MFSSFGVMSAVLAPDRAAPAHASEPAWPPPMTTTSYGLDAVSKELAEMGNGQTTYGLAQQQQDIAVAAEWTEAERNDPRTQVEHILSVDS